MAPNSERTEGLQVKLSTEMLARIDDFRFAQRLPSRAAAIRNLLWRGLEVNDEQRASGPDTSHSRTRRVRQ